MRSKFTATVLFVCSVALIIDSKQVAESVRESISLCLTTVIPSLFPLFVLSKLLSAQIVFPKNVFSKLLNISKGNEYLFLLGIICGFPVGAECVAQAYRATRLKKEEAMRMISFCSNCGPAFLFGMIGSFFDGLIYPFAIMVITILSALICAHLFGRPSESDLGTVIPQPIGISAAMDQSLSALKAVCGWIVLFRILTKYLDAFILTKFHLDLGILLKGTLEITQGTINLNNLSQNAFKFIFACFFSSFGGICVWLQTQTICNKLSLDSRFYLPQKAIQGFISILLGILFLIFPYRPSINLILTVISVCIAMLFLKKGVEIPRQIIYNAIRKGGI